MALDSTLNTGSSTAGKTNVDTNYNLQTNLPYTTPAGTTQGGGKTTAGFATMQCEHDQGTITGTRVVRSPDVSTDDRLSVGLTTSLAQYNFTAGTQNTGDFKHAFTTMTMTQSAGFLNINPALATVSGNYAYLQSWKYFSLWGDGDLRVDIVGQSSGTVPPANQIFETGLFLGTAGVAPADGVFFRFTSAGLAGIISYNGVETSTGVIVASISAVTNGKYTIIISQRGVEFLLDGIVGGTIPVPAGQSVPYLTLNLPMCYMMRNSGTVSGGVTIKIGTAHVTQSDLNTVKPWSHQMAGQGNAYQGQEGDTQGSLAIYSNSALGAAAALTNTTAAAPNVGLGGAVLVLPTLTAGTDGILFSYLNPVGSVTQPPKTLVVNGVIISGGVQVILAGGPLNLVFGVAYGHTALSLATAETGSFVTATTKSPRRVLIGVLNAIITAPAGTGLGQVDVSFASPIVVNPGEYFQITCRNVGTVTTTGALILTAAVDHYFE
jgi:hypothetical protein